MPPRSPATAEPAFWSPPAWPVPDGPAGPPVAAAAPLRWAATAAAREPCWRMPARRPGATMSTSSTEGSAECTPPTTGATSRSRTRLPIRRRTRADTLVAPSAVPSEAGSTASTEARRDPSRPSDRRTSGSHGLAGMPSTPVLGSSRGPSGNWTQAPPGFGATISPASPSSASRSATAAVRVAKDSAPLSRVSPATTWLPTQPPQASPASRTVVRTPARANSRAASSPEIPPPITTAVPSTGVPVAPASTPLLRSDGVDEFDDAREHLRVRLRRHTVAEVQDVPGRRGAGRDHLSDVGFEDFPRRRKQCRVDVALQRDGAAEAAVGFVQRQPVVDPHDVDADVAHRDEQFRGAGAEVDQGCAQVPDMVQGTGRRRRNEALVVGKSQRTGPGVEELAGGGAGFQLC